MPISATPRPVADPTIPYDKALVSLSIRGLVQDNAVKAMVNFAIQKYRVLSDGVTLDVAPGVATEHHDDAFVDAANDPALATAVGAIQAAIQAYITTKGY